MIQVVTGDPRPIFKQIVDGIRLKIASGEMPPGTKLPSVRALAMQITVNVNTVAKAYLDLTADGLIESQKGVEEFDARDRALVWRTMGGKHRYLLGEADGYALDDMEDLRRAVAECFDRPVPLTLEAVEAEHAALGRRLERFGRADDATEIWSALGVQNPKTLPLLGKDDFLALAERVKERGDA